MRYTYLEILEGFDNPELGKVRIEQKRWLLCGPFALSSDKGTSGTVLPFLLRVQYKPSTHGRTANC